MRRASWSLGMYVIVALAGLAAPLAAALAAYSPPVEAPPALLAAPLDQIPIGEHRPIRAVAPAESASVHPNAPQIPARPVAKAAGAALANLPAQTAAFDTLHTGLEVPWALAWASDGRLFFTERPGRVRVVENGVLQAEPVATLPASQRASEGGLMGLALAPDFAQSGAMFVYYTYDAADGLRNRISRLDPTGSGAPAETPILNGLPGASVHDGGALRFGPDGKLYAGTGDARQMATAQDPASLAGKVLRLNPDGSPPDDNPFPGSLVYSLGHRNVQGLAWHPQTGALYAAEHGPTGENGWCCHDEINLIVPGGNYGWPEVVGAAGDPRFRDPVAESGEGRWPPGGLAFASAGPWAGDLFLGSLAGGQLWRLTLTPDGQAVAARDQLVAGELGRLRAVTTGPDGAIYLATSNRDGRGRPNAGDDRLLRLIPAGE
jgi:aldose sugar dehydrogenase